MQPTQITEKYVRKPLFVDAVQVTTQNFTEIARWCFGEIKNKDDSRVDYSKGPDPEKPQADEGFRGGLDPLHGPGVQGLHDEGVPRQLREGRRSASERRSELLFRFTRRSIGGVNESALGHPDRHLGPAAGRFLHSKPLVKDSTPGSECVAADADRITPSWKRFFLTLNRRSGLEPIYIGKFVSPSRRLEPSNVPS
jgi:hypothetical protein